MGRNEKQKPRFEEKYLLKDGPNSYLTVDWVKIERKYLDREPTAKDKRCERCQYLADENGNTDDFWCRHRKKTHGKIPPIQKTNDFII